MKKLLFLTSELPWPVQSGGKLKTFKLLESLAERYEVTLVCPLKSEDSENLTAFYRVSPCRAHLHEPVERSRSAKNLLRSYLGGIPLNVYRSFSRVLAARTRRIAGSFDLIFLDHYELHSYIPADYYERVVYHAHNTYHKIWKSYAQTPGKLAMRAVAWLEYLRVKHYEERVCRNSELVFAAPGDIVNLTGSGVGVTKFHPTYHLGDSSQLSLPDLDFQTSEKKLIYIGFLGWEPNVTGLLWFITHVWPWLEASIPDLRFDIVGKGADIRLQEAVKNHSSIRLLGFVEDLESIYVEGRVSIAPLLFGSGMKVKVLDAMSRGMPVVTTSIGAESIDCENGKHLMITDSPKKMGQYVHSLLTDEALWKKLQSNSRSLIREKYTWDGMLADMHLTLEKIDFPASSRFEADKNGSRSLAFNS